MTQVKHSKISSVKELVNHVLMVLFVEDLVPIVMLQIIKIPYHNHVLWDRTVLVVPLTVHVLLERTVISNMVDMKMIVTHVHQVSNDQVTHLMKLLLMNVIQDGTV